MGSSEAPAVGFRGFRFRKSDLIIDHLDFSDNRKRDLKLRFYPLQRNHEFARTVVALTADCSKEPPMSPPPLTNEPWDEHLIRYGMPFAPRLIAKARGTLIWDTEGREILDFTSGQMCATLGHNHPRIVEAIRDACEGALHLFSGMLSPPVVALSQRLAALLPSRLSKALFLSTGGESNEAVLKMAKLHTGHYEVVGYTGAWHGMTSGAQSVNYVAGRQGYGPMMPGSLALPAPNAYRCPVWHRRTPGRHLPRGRVRHGGCAVDGLACCGDRRARGELGRRDRAAGRLLAEGEASIARSEACC